MVADLAIVIDISENHMSKIEGGMKPCTTANLYKLGQVLGVSVNYLMYGYEDAQDEVKR